uniref:serine--tRNA ligase n=1 Tax=Acrobeloides nanus TaxID=290746 RepID=A0A914C0R4_9BILA
MRKMEENARIRGFAYEFQQLKETWNRIMESNRISNEEIDNAGKKLKEKEYKELWNQLYLLGVRLPNTMNENVPIGNEPKVIRTFGIKRETDAVMAEQLIQNWHGIRYPLDASGNRSYTLIGGFAELEQNLLSFAYKTVLNSGFVPISVPDIVRRSTTEACGVEQRENQHAIQYILSDEQNLCLSGTAEMGIAELVRGKIFDEADLPLRLVAQSRCFRPEISASVLEHKLYRVHEFTKVEMFVICKEEESDRELENLLEIQSRIFQQLGFYCRVLDMPSDELGPPASRKFDIEAWMPGRKMFGEVSSASNCTDFQSRRLGLRYRRAEDGTLVYPHTCNGTAIASSRALITLVETHQYSEQFKKSHRIQLKIPEVLKTSRRTSPIKLKDNLLFHYNC